MLRIDEYTLVGDAEDDSLLLSLKRYRPEISSNIVRGDQVSVALILVHCVSTHKETWEPMLSDLFELQGQVKDASCVHISEAWAIDSPNHGQAAVLNEKALLERPNGISAYCWARGVQKLLKSGLILADEVVGIGHSAGASVIALSTVPYSLDNLPFKSIIIVEPGMMSREVFARAFKDPSHLKAVMESTGSRKDTWPSRTAALEWFKKRLPWNRWDVRTLHLLVEHGLRDLPTDTYPDRTIGVTLKCTRAQETVSYIYYEDAFDSLDRLTELCPVIPVHCILGSMTDLVSEETHRGILDPASGRKMASTVRVPCAGHLVAQENPAGLASAIFDALSHMEVIW